MDISQFIAQLLGVVYLVVGLGLLLNAKYYQKNLKTIISNPALPYFGGVIALIVGYLIVYFHNIWVMDWVVLVTIVGWMSVLKGLMYLVTPEFGVNIASRFVKKMNISVASVVVVAIGLLFLYLGFFTY